MDFVAQALAKLERGHAQDVTDVRALIERSLVDADSLLAGLEAAEAGLDRYPAVDGPSWRAAVEAMAAGGPGARPGVQGE